MKRLLLLPIVLSMGCAPELRRYTARCNGETFTVEADWVNYGAGGCAQFARRSFSDAVTVGVACGCDKITSEAIE